MQFNKRNKYMKLSIHNKLMFTKNYIKFVFVIVAIMTLMLASCNISEPPDKPNEKETPNDTVKLGGNVQVPTWAVDSNYDYSTSMTAIVKVDLTINYALAVDGEGKLVDSNIIDSNDLLAAFIGNTCVGVANPTEGLFYLYINDDNSAEAVKNISLRYYSAKLQNMFEAKDVLVFKNDDRIGTVSEPFTPAFTLAEQN